MEQTVYLITGANRGIGRGMAAGLLLRPRTLVIATVRDDSSETAQSLSSLPTGADSKLVVLALLDEDPKFGYDTLRHRLEAISQRIDVVIANAGTTPAMKGVLDTPVDDLGHCFAVNSVGPFKLFKASWPFLERSDDRKFVLISSSMGSIAGLDEEDMPGLAYGMSKAAANYLAKKISVGFKDKGLAVGIIHPGWVKTSMGQTLADAVSWAEPPMTVDDSCRQVLEQIDALSLETTSGKYIMFNGEVLPW